MYAALGGAGTGVAGGCGISYVSDHSFIITEDVISMKDEFSFKLFYFFCWTWIFAFSYCISLNTLLESKHSLLVLGQINFISFFDTLRITNKKLIFYSRVLSSSSLYIVWELKVTPNGSHNLTQFLWIPSNCMGTTFCHKLVQVTSTHTLVQWRLIYAG